MKTPKRVEGNEMPSRPMNAEPPQPTGEGKARSPQEGEMPTRTMDEPEPNIPARAPSPKEQDKLAAYRRDQAARAAAAGKDKMPTGT
jgi:hypothetical protein